jgi:hypothetical protein
MLDSDIIASARDVADWMVSHQRKDGSWPYAYNDDGTEALSDAPSSTIWNVWSLYRFGKLTGDTKYSLAAERAKSYFEKTFTENMLYRGYWEDNYGQGRMELNTTQGYEACIAALAFAEMGDEAAMVRSTEHVLRFVCTRELESRTYWTSYGGVSEQQGWAPGTYVAPSVGYAAHVAWRRTGEDIFHRFSDMSKIIGWWQDPKTGGPFWLSQAITQQPIEMYREGGGGRSSWALWDGAQKVTFAVPWLVDEVNRRSGDQIKIDTESLSGKDDRGKDVDVKLFNGDIESKSGQVNWLGLRTVGIKSGGEYQLVLINHAETTDVIVKSSFKTVPVAVRLFDADGHSTKSPEHLGQVPAEIMLQLPEKHMAIIVWDQ